MTLDGFIFSDNMELKGYEVKNTGFRFSDHEPVMMRFVLKGEWRPGARFLAPESFGMEEKWRKD